MDTHPGPSNPELNPPEGDSDGYTGPTPENKPLPRKQWTYTDSEIDAHIAYAGGYKLAHTLLTIGACIETDLPARFAIKYVRDWSIKTMRKSSSLSLSPIAPCA
jgi:hypothetical protein